MSPSVRTAERKTTGDTPSLQGPCQHNNMDIMLNSGSNSCLHVSVGPGWKKQELKVDRSTKFDKNPLRKTCLCDAAVSEIKDYARNLNVQIKD